MLQTSATFARVFRSLVAISGLSLISHTVVANDHDQYIPSDTPYYMGSGQGMPLKHLLAFQPSLPPMDDVDGEAKEFLDSMVDVMNNLDTVLPEWGVEGDINFSVYSVGINPVVRVALADKEKFDKSLKALETEHKIAPQMSDMKDYTVRYYGRTSFPEKDDEGGETEVAANGDFEIMVAAGKDDLVFSFVKDQENEELIQRVLGITPPEQSISESGKLKKFRKRWGYNDLYASFIDMRVIADIVTGEESDASKALSALAKDQPQAMAMQQMMRSEPCRAEVRALAENWPMFVMGAREFDIDDGQLSYVSHGAAEIGHQELAGTLKLLSGVLPASQSSVQAMLSFGLGISVDQLSQVIGQLTTIISSLNYECPLLAELDKLSETDLSPASMGVVMFGGLARGVQGMSWNVFDLDIDPSASSSQPIKGVDAAITITATDPKTLVQTLQMMPQLGMLAELPLDGTEISLNSMLPIPMPEGVEFKAALKEKNIVLFSGEKAADFISRLGGDNEKGFFNMRVDTRKIIDKVSSVMTMVGKNTENMQEVLGYLDSYPKGTISYDIDFTDNGIEFVGSAVIDAPE